MQQDPNKRPNINQILKNKLLEPIVRSYLSKSEFKEEFSHTILHKQNVFDRTHKRMQDQQAS